ncbi:MAG: hypothetical protein JXK94_10945 [Deltaproteobacteria bacterium]|nr:hypothetical protein [Deltaproteobacteria bacterium]
MQGIALPFFKETSAHTFAAILFQENRLTAIINGGEVKTFIKKRLPAFQALMGQRANRCTAWNPFLDSSGEAV